MIIYHLSRRCGNLKKKQLYPIFLKAVFEVFIPTFDFFCTFARVCRMNTGIVVRILPLSSDKI